MEQIPLPPRAWPILLLHSLKEPSWLLTYLACGTMRFALSDVIIVVAVIFVPLISNAAPSGAGTRLSRVPFFLLVVLIASGPAFAILILYTLPRWFFLAVFLATDTLLIATHVASHCCTLRTCSRG